jgi:hypothetical protein
MTKPPKFVELVANLTLSNYSAELYGTSFPHVFSGNPAFVASVDARPLDTFGHDG